MHIRTGNIEYSYEISRKILKKIKHVFYRIAFLVTIMFLH